MSTRKIKMSVNQEKYEKYKNLVKNKKNQDVTYYNIELFEKAMDKEIEELKQLPDKRRIK